MLVVGGAHSFNLRERSRSLTYKTPHTLPYNNESSSPLWLIFPISLEDILFGRMYFVQPQDSFVDNCYHPRSSLRFNLFWQGSQKFLGNTHTLRSILVNSRFLTVHTCIQGIEMGMHVCNVHLLFSPCFFTRTGFG